MREIGKNSYRTPQQGIKAITTFSGMMLIRMTFGKMK
jgi:hypothetical protein